MPTPWSSLSGLQKAWVSSADWDLQEGSSGGRTGTVGLARFPPVANHQVSFKAAG